MTLLALPGLASTALDCSARSKLGSVKAGPRMDSAPAWRDSRRVMPSQARRGLPSMVSIGGSQDRRLRLCGIAKPQAANGSNFPALAVFTLHVLGGFLAVGDFTFLAVEL